MVSTRIITTWSHKNTYLCATPFYVPYWTLRHSFKEKCPLSGAITQVKYVNPDTFYYVDIGTYGCVFITLLQVHIAVVQNSTIRGLSIKVNALSCPTPNPSLNFPDSVNKCKTDIKTYLLMQPCHFDLLTCRFVLFCQTMITRDLNRSSSPPKCVSVLCEIPIKLTVYENL